jgi:tight adherence protein C
VSVAPVLAAAAVLLGFAAARELVGVVPESFTARVRRRLAPARSQRPLLAAKLAGAGLGALVAALVAPVVPSRLGVVVGTVLVAGGFMSPDAVTERRERRRRRRLVAALPDVLDLLAVGSAAGRGLGALLGELATASSGPLGEELATTAAAIETGTPFRDAIDDLRGRVGGPEVGAVAAAIERSRALGSPLAEQLHMQATALRLDARRRVAERAARAAPKIQLVVALLLVPSVLLLVAAALVPALTGTSF